MKYHPILFSAPMVRALLDGTKTQTRRIAKLTEAGHVKEPSGHRRWHPADPNAQLACPYGQPGDRLWVREAFRAESVFDQWKPSELQPACGVWYEANGHAPKWVGKLRQSMFMPRWASRITLEITSVRVERLAEICEADCIAEGTPGGHGAIPGYAYNATAKEHYHHTWEQINGPNSWAANPWVWVVEFQVVQA